MSVFKIERKIDWKEVAKIASRKYGKKVSSSYCRDVYRGHHDSYRLKGILRDIIDIKPNQRKEENHNKQGVCSEGN